MSFGDFVDKHRERYRENGLSAVPPALKDLGVSAISKTPYVSRYGTNVFEKEWDVLVILDGCRYDMYQEVIGETDTIWSRGSTSPEWMKNNFRTSQYQAEKQNTAVVSSNPFTSKSDRNGRPYLPKEDFGLVDEVWTYGWDEELGTTKPETVTDRAIDVTRNENYDRTIVHYMQPHYPFIGGEEIIGKMDVDSFGEFQQGANTENVWADIFHGERDDIDNVIHAYYRNLKFVFEYVETLLENVDGTVAVSADHGNLLGEYGLWGHRTGLVVPELRRVPWDVYECADEKTYTPQISPNLENSEDVAVSDRLESLGYI